MPITLSDTDINRINITYEANALPVCNLTVANKNGKYTSASAIVDEGMPIIISTSENYRDFVRLFSGSIYQKESNLSPDGQSMLYLRCRDERLARVWVECNTGVIDGKDIGGAFTGSATATDGSPWAADPQGNYPNGLLYDTSFTYSDPSGDVSDYYTGSLDIPKIVFTHEPRFTAINRVADLFDLKWYINPSDQTFAVYSGRVSYAAGNYTASYGENINRSSLLADNLRSCSGVRVFGPAPYFFETGSEPFHEIYDGGLISLTEAKEIGLRWYENYTVSTKGGTIKAPIITNSVIGKNIEIDDSARGWDAAGDIIGIRHDISTDRAMTELIVDNEKFTEPKTFAAVLDELEKMRQDENYTGKFDCFKHMDRNDSDVTTASPAPTGSPCAIVIGTKSSVVTSTPEKVIDVQPIVGKVDNTYYSYWGPKIAESWDFDGDAILLKEIAVINNPTGNLLNSTRTLLFHTRPTTTASWDADANWEYALGTFSHAIDYVQLEYDQPLITEDDVKVGWTTDVSIPHALHPTGSVWQDSDEHSVVSASDLKSMSWDYISKSANYFLYTHSVGGTSHEWVGIRFAVDTHLGEFERQDIDYFRINVVARVSGSNAENGDPMTNFNIGLHDIERDSMNYWPSGSYQTYYNTASGWQYYTVYFNFSASDGRKMDGAGKTYPILFTCDTEGNPKQCSISTDVVFEVAYVEHAFQRGIPSKITMCEKVTYIDEGLGLQVSHPIGIIHGFYSASQNGTCSGENLGVWSSSVTWDAIRCIAPPEAVIRKVNLQELFKGNIVGQNYWADMGSRNVKVNWRDLMAKLGVDDLYMKYTVKWEKPTNMDTIPANVKYYKIDRGDNAGTDKVRWVRATSSDDILQGHKKPLYGESVSYEFIEAGYDATVSARWTSSIGLDKTLDKTLTVAWQDS